MLPMRYLSVLCCLGAVCASGTGAEGPVTVAPPAPGRVAEIAGLLQKEPVIPPVGDTAFWTRAAQVPALQGEIALAEEALDTPFVDLADFDRTYRRFMDDGNRKVFFDLITPSVRCLQRFALAECLERQGRFIEPLEQRIRAICAWPTWMLSAHDWKRRNLEGKTVQIDLGVAMRAADFGAIVLTLGDELDPEVVALVRANLRRRVLEPYRRELEGAQAPMWWLTTTNNWNAVCQAGVVVAALAASQDATETAWYLAAVERMIGNFLAGFTADGYCSEGIGYWGYGYGHFIVVIEYLRRATGGGVDLLAGERAQKAAGFPLGIALVDGWHPAFADCKVDEPARQPWSWYAARRLGTADPGADTLTHPGADGPFYARPLFLDPTAVPPAATAAAAANPLRSTFPDGGVYVMRAPGERPFAAAIKAGHNDEHHNHNDVGSFTVVAGDFPLLCDPGKEHYTRFTFDRRHRYKRPVHNSYGHPVPQVAGQLQGTGRRFAGTVLSHETSDEVDTVTIDLAGAYAVKELQSLVRTLRFDRQQRRITLSDTVRFSTPQTFETALVTYAQIEHQGTTLTITQGEATGTVTVAVTGAEETISTSVLEADWQLRKPERWPAARQPSRIAVACDRAVLEATITLTISVP